MDRTQTNTGVEAEFAAFVAGCSPALHRSAYLLTGDRERAQDVVQTALTRIYLAWARRSSWASPEAYAHRVVARVVLSSARRRWWGERAAGDLPEPPAADEIAEIDDRDALRRALLALPVKQRTAVVLRHYLDLSEADVALAMGCPIGSVKSLTSRALATLRIHLRELAL